MSAAVNYFTIFENFMKTGPAPTGGSKSRQNAAAKTGTRSSTTLKQSNGGMGDRSAG
jgi:hypothetical protein